MRHTIGTASSQQPTDSQPSPERATPWSRFRGIWQKETDQPDDLDPIARIQRALNDEIGIGDSLQWFL